MIGDDSVERFRKTRKFLESIPDVGSKCSRIDLIRIVKSRNNRKECTPQQKWCSKKIEKYRIKTGWGIVINDHSN